MTQLVKNPPETQETWVQSLGWEDPLVKGKAIPTPVFWPGEFHGLYSPWGRKESDTTVQLSLSLLGLNSDLLTGTPLGIEAAGESIGRVSDCRKAGKKVESSSTLAPIPLLIAFYVSAVRVVIVLQSLSHVRPFVTPWTVAARLLCPWDFLGKNTGVGCHFLLRGIFPTQ